MMRNGKVPVAGICLILLSSGCLHKPESLALSAADAGLQIAVDDRLLDDAE